MFVFPVTFISSAAGYSPNAAQFFGRITDPGTTRKNLYAALIDGLVSDGVWSKLDVLYVYAADISGNALVNLPNGTYSGSIQGSEAFTTDQGFNLAGSGDYVDTGFNASTASSPNYAQNSAHFSVWDLTIDAGASNQHALFGNSVSGAAGDSHIYPAYVGTDFYGRLNDGSAAVFGTVSNTSGHRIASRVSSSTVHGYANGTEVGTGVSSTSHAVVNGSFRAGCVSGDPTGTSNQVAAVSIGSSLTATDASNLYSRLQTYLHAVGAV